MLAASGIHKALFSLSFLFGLGPPLLSTEVGVHIDRKVQTGRISYHQLISTEGKEEKLAAALEKLQRAKSFQKGIKGLRFKEAMLNSQEDELRIEVFFVYEDEEAMLRQLGIQKDGQERLRFRLAEREELLESNGDPSKGVIRWDDDVRKLHFKLAGQPLNKMGKGKAVEFKEKK